MSRRNAVWTLLAAAFFLLAALPRRSSPRAADPDPPARGGADASYEQHIEALRERLGEDGQAFTIVIQPPFVVLGDEAEAVVRRRAKSTVKWAVDSLKRDFFREDPAHIIDVYLFRDADSYLRHARAFFGDVPTSPYGYYSHTDRAMVMNIATGGGTLVHEIVHAFVAANFPACPAWFNEGLASLYEQCRSRDGHIIGLPNWRLPGLQEAIEAGTLPTFERLCTTTTGEFYLRDRGTNYAQARYLCYHLQERGLLRAYYTAFVASHVADSSGNRTLVTLLEEGDMTAFQARWEADMMDLQFP